MDGPSSTDRIAFQMYFGKNLLSYCHPLYGFDIIRFDKLMKDEFGYVEDGLTSCKDFIRSKWGDKGVDFVEHLMNHC